LVGWSTNSELILYWVWQPPNNIRISPVSRHDSCFDAALDSWAQILHI